MHKICTVDFLEYTCRSFTQSTASDPTDSFRSGGDDDDDHDNDCGVIKKADGKSCASVNVSNL